MSRARVWIMALLSCSALPARAQAPADLQQQLEQLKKQYEETARELQRRIAALEQQIQESKAAATAAATATAERLARETAQKTVLSEMVNVGQQYQGRLPSQPTYDLLPRLRGWGARTPTRRAV
jgi:Skp family chaperone for outer membrane proteins